MSTARQLATERLLEVVACQRHPSHQLLDRLERSLRTREDLRAYVQFMLQLTADQCHPSLRLLDRLDRCTLAHELTASDEEEEDQG